MKPARLIISVSLIVLLVAACGVAAWACLGRARHAQKRPVPSDTIQAFDASVWAWKNEEHWAVAQMARDVTEMLLFAAGEKPEAYTVATQVSDPRTHAYTTSLKGPRFPQGFNCTSVLASHLWDPDSFTDMAGQLVGKLGIAPTPPGPSSSRTLLEQLLTPTPAQIEKLQASVSSDLNKHPASSTYHEEAAAVLSVFAMYDHAGVFRDDRSTLCRIASHLTVARALHPIGSEAGPAGRFSDICLLVITSQTARAAQELERIRQIQPLPVPEPWTRALGALVTGDWRLVGEASKATLAEALAAFSGRMQAFSDEAAVKWLDGERPAPNPFQAFINRTVLASNPSVQLGHRFTYRALDWDMEDIRTVFRLRNDGRSIPAEQFCAILNAHPGRAYNASSHALEVISWGNWAHRFQADLLLDMMCTVQHTAHKYGSREAADEFIGEIERDFSGLDLFPILQKRYSNFHPAVYKDAILEAAALARSHPESVSDCNFVCINMKTPFGDLPKGLPRYRNWLAFPVPYGTAYNFAARTYEMEELKGLKADDYRKLRETDPYNRWLINRTLEAKGGDKPSPEVVEQTLAPIKSFSEIIYISWMVRAYGKDSPKAIPLLERSAVLAPDRYVNLGRALLLQKRESEAAEAFLKAFRRCEDRVMVSNNMDWLVPYLERTGQRKLAEEVAEDCADTYSYRGLETMARLRESQGRLEEAGSWFGKIEERYENPDELIAFYVRHADRDVACKAKLDARVVGAFPKGLVKYDQKIEGPRPTKGVAFRGLSKQMEDARISKDAIIVALDGFKVGNTKQYALVRSFTKDEHLRLVLFQDGSYRNIEVTLPGRRFGVDIADYSAPDSNK